MDTAADEALLSKEHARPIPPRYWWLKRILAVLVPFFVAVVALRVWWGHLAGSRLQAAIDRYRAAGQPVFPSDFNPPAVPDDNNAALMLLDAIAAIVHPAEVSPELKDANGKVDFSEVMSAFRAANQGPAAEYLDDVRVLVQANEEALRLAREARAMTDVDWGIEFSSPLINAMLPNLQGHRQLAKLLCVSALYYHRIGDDFAAVEALRDTLRLSAAVGGKPTLIAHLVSVAVSALATSAVESIASGLIIGEAASRADAPAEPANPAQVRTLIDELLDEEPLREGWRWAIYTERAMQLDAVGLISQGHFDLMTTGGGGEPPIPAREFSALFRPVWQLDALRMLTHTTGVGEAGAASNYVTAKNSYPRLPPTGSGLRRLTRILSSLLIPSLHRAMELHFRTLAERRMAAVALAIRLYEVDHAHRPTALGAVVPGYLSSLPTDPYSPDDRPMGYAPGASKPVLYCIGPDGIDDGGAFAFRSDGSVDPDAKDHVFFLGGYRPRANGSSSDEPTSTQAGDHNGDQEEGQRDADHDHDPNRDPEDRHGEGE